MIKRPPQKPIKDLFQPEFDTQSIYSLSKEDLTELMMEWDEDDYRGSQVFEWLYDHRVDNFDEMKNLPKSLRSEEHTSELQSRFDLVCRLLLEKKKIIKNVEHR